MSLFQFIAQTFDMPKIIPTVTLCAKKYIYFFTQRNIMHSWLNIGLNQELPEIQGKTNILIPSIGSIPATPD